MTEIKILVDFEGVGTVECTLSDKNNPKTYVAVIDKIPFESKANTWGEEIYFDTPISAPLENSKKKVNIGDVAYWPPGK
ncbi:MAG: cyclophilin-like family protein, partial [Thermoproteota archaeon]